MFSGVKFMRQSDGSVLSEGLLVLNFLTVSHIQMYLKSRLTKIAVTLQD